MKVLLNRYSDDGKETIGKLYVLNKKGYILFECETLELPWKDNQSNVSCIPAGQYKVKKRWSEKYNEHFHITGVPNRDYILIHPANYVSQLRGCVAVGRDLADINNDGLMDVTSSKATLSELLTILPSEFFIEILFQHSNIEI